MMPWRQSLTQAGVGLIWGMAGAALVLAIAQVADLPPRAPRLATVDMASLVQTARTDALKAAVAPQSSAQEQRRAAEQMAAFGRRLDQVLAQLAAERGVVIVQRQAVAAGGLPDLTAEAGRRLAARESGARDPDHGT
ncbi:MAG: hypothetical protein ACOY4D_05790 [Pseudomonadota bacterium]